MAYQKKTLRRMSPRTREYAKLCNEFEKLLKRLKKQVDVMASLELDSQALQNQSRIKNNLDSMDQSILAKTVNDIQF